MSVRRKAPKVMALGAFFFLTFPVPQSYLSSMSGAMEPRPRIKEPMNIFVLDTDPAKAAKSHCDTHVVKMILETTQILCTVRHMAGNPVPDGYKPTHQHHPCTKWAGECMGNYDWLHDLLFYLHKEYEHRYQKAHASRRLWWPTAPSDRSEIGHRTPFVFAGPDSCIRPTIVESYRALYRLKQTTMKRPMRWTSRPRPEWMDA